MGLTVHMLIIVKLHFHHLFGSHLVEVLFVQNSCWWLLLLCWHVLIWHSCWCWLHLWCGYL